MGKVIGIFYFKTYLSKKFAYTEVTGTPVSSQVRYHNPVVANNGRIHVKNALFSGFPVFLKIRRLTSPTPPKAVENTRAVGL